jgi:hypothetical protein
MKTLMLLMACLTSCGPSNNPPHDTPKNVKFDGGHKSIDLYTIIIDGNEYYGVYIDRSFSLCPKLPAK